MEPNEQHVYHHYDNDGPRITVKVEKNSRGFNYEVSISGCRTTDEAMTILKATQARMQAQFGVTPEGPQ